MADQSNRPIIIKRKKVVAGGGHHGGAWKIAYADFVTAMMAFFLLMWLINATSEEQRLGLAEYFSPTIPLNRIAGGGSHMFGGKSVTEEQILSRSGRGGLPTNMTGQPGTEESDESAMNSGDKFSDVQDYLVGGGGESFLKDNLEKHVVTRLTDEGLVIELFAIKDDPLFVDGEATPMPIMGDLVEIIAKAAQMVNNNVAVEGHVRTEPVVLRESRVWDLSTARAATVREMLENFGVAPHRLARVVGHADRELMSNAPRDVRNNRIEIILLRE
ncbi:chemotaxis protein MotB [Shimia isoporae]|uniref:Chemotaxis protein MotB n=1 Tax=Shimia isoporae TaxID=647720 RepID=A0A4R1N457_9RHOB|nr:flagellar motor protein MotB [Shimia isoporae]TCL01426.1 chemotaxis protein MotB [Shimia isoporae]